MLPRTILRWPYFLEDNSPALSNLQGRGLDKHRFADYCEIQRAFIQQEIDRYDRAAACPCALIDLGPQEIEFYTLFYPASIGKDWPVRQALAAELAALRRCRIDRTLFLQASVSVLQQRKEGDTTRDRGFFSTTPYNTCCLPRSVGLQRNPAWIFWPTDNLTQAETAAAVLTWVQRYQKETYKWNF